MACRRQLDFQNMFNIGTKPRLDTMDKRAREQLSKEKYKTWSDIWDKGFPKTAEEYKRVSKMRPETMEDWELIQDMKPKKGDIVTNAQLK